MRAQTEWDNVKTKLKGGEERGEGNEAVVRAALRECWKREKCLVSLVMRGRGEGRRQVGLIEACDDGGSVRRTIICTHSQIEAACCC